MDRVARVLTTLSYSEIARRSGTTVAFVSRLFRGQRQAKMETLGKIAKALGVTLDDIYTYLGKVPKVQTVKCDNGQLHGWQGSNGKGKGKGRKAKAPVGAAA